MQQQSAPVGAGAPVGSPPGSPPTSRSKRGKPPVADAVAPVAPRSPAAMKLMDLSIDGISGQALGAIKKPMDGMEATKSIKALEHVADKSTVLTRALREAALEQDSRLSLALLRVETLEKRATETEDAHQLAVKTAERHKGIFETQLQAMAVEANE